ncbi:MAG: carbohydrate ABC transporter substrate-binding protein [Kiritimatiellales bacterium]|nr:carbohydrate ABC transporter substrate-binding protein [Kiritimatiellales bacterium]
MIRRLTSCLMSLFFCVCTGWTEEPARQELRWMGHWKNEGLREQLVREVQEDFQFLHQEVNISMTFASDLLPQKNQKNAGILIADMIRSGRIDWDVVWMDPQIYQTVAAELDDPDWGAKHLVDFSEFPDVKAAHKSFLVDGPDCHQDTGGIFVGPYIEGFYTCLWYNTAVAEKLGLEINEKEMSADDLLGYLLRIKEYNQTAETPVSGFVDFIRSGSFTRLAHNLYLSEHLAHPDTPAEEIQTHILRFYEAMQPCDPLLYDSPSNTWREAAQLLSEDNVLFVIEPTWFYNMVRDHFPKLLNKLYPAQMPGFEKQSFYVGGFMPAWAVMKNSPVRDVSVELMRFWSSPATAEKWVRYTKSPTGLSGSLYDSEYGMDSLADFQRRLISGRNLQPDILFFKEDDSPISPILDYIYPIIRGEMTADEALTKMKTTDE